MNRYSKYNNIPFLVCIIMVYLQNSNGVSISRLFLILPLMLDDVLMKRIVRSSENMNMSNLVFLFHRTFANYNKRYYSLLPYLITSVSLLMDMRAAYINKGYLCKSHENVLDDMCERCLSERVKDISNAVPVLLKITEKYSTKELFTLFNVQL